MESLGYLRGLMNAFLGRPMAMLPASGFNAATMGRRTLNIGQTTRGVNSLALADGPNLLAKARKAGIDNPLVVNGIRSFVAEVVGTGIRPHSKHSDPVIRTKLEKEFALWVPQSSATRRLSATGADSMQDFYGQEALICGNLVEAGEAFARLRPRLASDLSPSGLRVPLQIDLIEPEQLAFWRMSADGQLPGNIVRASIEFDQLQQRVAYHFYREHPGDSTIFPNAFEIVRVPSASVLHIMEFQRGNQIRGISSLASILIQIADVDDYDDAERLRQKLGAFLFGWRKTVTPDDPQTAGMTSTVGTDQAPAGAAYVEVQPGQLEILDTNAGEEFGFYSHPGVPGGYEAFMRKQHQMAATILRVTYDMLTGDNSSTTFMNARIRLMSLRRIWKQFQNAVLIHQFCRPLWRAWLDAAALVNIINAADYAKHPEEYLNVEWTGQPWEWVDPIKDIESKRMEIESCLTSREATVAELARDVEEVDAAISRDHKREAELGITPVYGASKVSETLQPGDNPDIKTAQPAPGGKK